MDNGRSFIDGDRKTSLQWYNFISCKGDADGGHLASCTESSRWRSLS
ncbi:MAG: hypothetical protein ACYTXE_41420 [Nostoc sp.]